MIIEAAILVVLIILFAFLSFSSFISTIIGFTKKRKKLWAISLVVCLSSVCLFSLIAMYTSKKVVNRASATTRTLAEKIDSSIMESIDPNPDIRFTQITGLEWPETAKIITTGDTYFLGEGEFYLVFEVDQEVLETWLSNPPPWEGNEWKSGPVPQKIGYHTTFGTSGTIIGGTEYIGDEQLVKLLNSNSIWYVAKERCCSDRDYLEFHNGNLLIIDLDSNRVWLSIWDF